MILCWTVVQLNHDSSAQTTALPGTQTVPPTAFDPVGASLRIMMPELDKTAGPAPVQGPALQMPEEVVAMLQQRQEDLERRERTVRMAEERLALLKAEVEQILSKVEASEQRRLLLKEQQEKAAVQEKLDAEQRAVQEKQEAELRAVQDKQAAELRKQQYAQLTKIYESMPAEEAAARIERMPDRKALEILRLVKGKTAGSILAQVKVERAAKLTEQLLSKP